MMYKYDAESDTLVLKLSKKKPDYGEQTKNIITHYTKTGKTTEIEILDARSTAKKIMKLITKAKKR
jgi:uncharacterized protein YuzE